MINIHAFCNSEDSANELLKKMKLPWSSDDHTFASNGHVLVRVNRLDGIAVDEDLNKDISDTIDLLIQPSCVEPVSIPDLPDEKPCPRCVGTGYTYERKCPECDGDGIVVFENDFNIYECDCDTCGGGGVLRGKEGEKVPCDLCEGTRRDEKHELSRIAIGNTGFSVRVLRELKQLDGVKIYPFNDDSPSYFTFVGGDGLVMPCQE